MKVLENQKLKESGRRDFIEIAKKSKLLNPIKSSQRSSSMFKSKRGREFSSSSKVEEFKCQFQEILKSIDKRIDKKQKAKYRTETGYKALIDF